ncbi:MAG: oligopeptide transport system permease protein [Myxococcota bacterium]|jgi:oligopeptide transport system permease protein
MHSNPFPRWQAAVLLLICIIAILAPQLPLADYSAMDTEQLLVAPQLTSAPYLGTDAQGRDMLARLVSGSRISLSVGLFGTIVALLIGVPFGAFAGLGSRRRDSLLMRFADALESIPMVVFILFMLSILQEYRIELAGIGFGRLQLFFVAIGVLFWLPTARVVRAECRRINSLPFVDAARSQGMRQSRIFKNHILPQLWPAIGSMLIITLPRVILMEAFLSFLGLGVESPTVSWGRLASDGMATLNPLVDAGWLIYLPSIALVGCLLLFQRLARWARDYVNLDS